MRVRYLEILPVIFFFIPLYLFGQSPIDAYDFYYDSGSRGAKSVGLGGAFVAVADDYNAILTNPAGLSLAKKITLQISGGYLSGRNDSEYQKTANTFRHSDLRLGGVTIIFPFPVYRGSFVIAAGYQELKNFSSGTTLSAFDTLSNEYFIQYRYADGTIIPAFTMKNVERLENISESGNLNAWSLAAALDLSPDLSVGFSLHYLRGSFSYLNLYSQYDILDLYNDPALGQDVEIVGGTREVKYELSGWETNLGIMYSLGKTFRLGINARIPLSFRVDENYSDLMTVIFDNPADLPIEGYQRGKFNGNYGYRYPFTVSFGAAKTFGPLLLSLQADYQDWSTLALEDSEEEFSHDFHRVIFWRGGVEYNIFCGFYLRAGYYYAESPGGTEERFSGRDVFSGGFSWKLGNKFIADFSARYFRYEKLSPGDDIMPADAKINTSVADMRLDLKYRF